MPLQTIDADSFVETVLRAAGPVIVLFSDAGTNRSRNMIASLQAVACDQGAAITVVNKVFDEVGSIEQDPAYDVQSAPTTLFFKNGKLERTVVGYYAYTGIFKTWVEQLSQV
ncbi:MULTISPECIES: thioredoxin family protein [Pseudomonas]|jgi:thioredoxin 1|uniref:Thioredoxin n=1 Tax=Pseudomonas reactans TaxID=117680 RepID=A0A7Y8KH41_9PSED|nr:hypothetical protein [Pseudomonas reactans]NWD80659.1 hypothetical protein [Pseudomonas reactans]NWE89261.1 hypothetical protein [Pseudomonas reactans]